MDRARASLPIPMLRIDDSGRLVVDLDAPTLHTMVFGSGVVGLTRILLALMAEQSVVIMILAYLGALAFAFTLSRLASSRMRDRTPRLYSSALSLTGLVLYAVPGTMTDIEPSSTSNRLAAGAMVLLAVGTASAEGLHRLSRRWAPAEEVDGNTQD